MRVTLRGAPGASRAFWWRQGCGYQNRGEQWIAALRSSSAPCTARSEGLHRSRDIPKAACSTRRGRGGVRGMLERGRTAGREHHTFFDTPHASRGMHQRAKSTTAPSAGTTTRRLTTCATHGRPVYRARRHLVLTSSSASFGLPAPVFSLTTQTLSTVSRQRPRGAVAAELEPRDVRSSTDGVGPQGARVLASQRRPREQFER